MTTWLWRPGKGSIWQELLPHWEHPQVCYVSPGLNPAYSWSPESVGDLLWGAGSIGLVRSSASLAATSDLPPAPRHLPPSHHPPSINFDSVHLQLCLQYSFSSYLKQYLLLCRQGRWGVVGPRNECPPHLCLAGEISLYQHKEKPVVCFLSSVSLFSEASLSGTWWKSAGKGYRPVRPTAQSMPWACVPLLWSWAEGPSQLLPSKEILKDTELKPASPKHLWTLRFEFPDTFDLFSWLLPGASRQDRLCH